MDGLILDSQHRIPSKWAKRSLSRWLHGISTEPGSRSTEDELQDELRSNPLSDRELPVLLESTYGQVDMSTAFQEAGMEQEGTEIASAIPQPALENENDEPNGNPVQFRHKCDAKIHRFTKQAKLNIAIV